MRFVDISSIVCMATRGQPNVIASPNFQSIKLNLMGNLCVCLWVWKLQSSNSNSNSNNSSDDDSSSDDGNGDDSTRNASALQYSFNKFERERKIFFCAFLCVSLFCCFSVSISILFWMVYCLFGFLHAHIPTPTQKVKWYPCKIKTRQQLKRNQRPKYALSSRIKFSNRKV